MKLDNWPLLLAGGDLVETGGSLKPWLDRRLQEEDRRLHSRRGGLQEMGVGDTGEKVGVEQALAPAHGQGR